MKRQVVSLRLNNQPILGWEKGSLDTNRRIKNTGKGRNYDFPQLLWPTMSHW